MGSLCFEKTKMSPKNSTTPYTAQHPLCPLDAFTVNKTPFWGPPDNPIFEVCLNVQTGTALKEASSLMAGALHILEVFGDTEIGLDGNSCFAMRFLLESSKALLDAGTYGVEFQRVQGGDQ